MRFRRVDIFSRVSRSPGVVGVPARCGGGTDGRETGAAAGAGAGAVGAAARSRTSGLLTTPPRPVPVTPATSIPAAAATRRAAGDDLTSPSPEGAPSLGLGAAGAGLGAAGAGGGAAGAGGAATVAVEAGVSPVVAPAADACALAPAPAEGAAPTAFSSTSPSKSPTLTTVPSATARRASDPARGAGTSTVILSVSSSTSVSPLVTASPSFLSQRRTVASTIDSPSGGTFIGSIQVRAG